MLTLRARDWVYIRDGFRSLFFNRRSRKRSRSQHEKSHWMSISRSVDPRSPNPDLDHEIEHQIMIEFGVWRSGIDRSRNRDLVEIVGELSRSDRDPFRDRLYKKVIKIHLSG